jgi:predicted PurR-regulated permease PerM
MNQTTSNNNNLSGTVIHIAIQLLALSLLLAWCFRILEPFITLIVWSAVLAVSLYPLQQTFVKKFRMGNKLASAIPALLLLSIIIVPASFMMVSTVSQIKHTAEAYRAGEIAIPPPEEKVKEWPIIGEKVYKVWSDASNNLVPLIQDNQETLKKAALWIFNSLASTGKGIALLALAIIISGFLLAYGKSAGEFATLFFHRLSGESDQDYALLTTMTIRNVVKGILGVAFIQSALVCIGLVLADVPGAGLWTLICLILAIMQIGILPISVGIIIWAWNQESTTTAILLTIWLILVGISDNILKPILLGKGAPVPMLVVFLGAIGGFILSGFIGLFTGAVILSLGYRLFISWIKAGTAAPAK